MSQTIQAWLLHGLRLPRAAVMVKRRVYMGVGVPTGAQFDAETGASLWAEQETEIEGLHAAEVYSLEDGSGDVVVVLREVTTGNLFATWETKATGEPTPDEIAAFASRMRQLGLVGTYGAWLTLEAS